MDMFKNIYIEYSIEDRLALPHRTNFKVRLMFSMHNIFVKLFVISYRNYAYRIPNNAALTSIKHSLKQ